MIAVNIQGNIIHADFVRHGTQVKVATDFPQRLDREGTLKEELELFLSKNQTIQNGTIFSSATMGGWSFLKG